MLKSKSTLSLGVSPEFIPCVSFTSLLLLSTQHDNYLCDFLFIYTFIKILLFKNEGHKTIELYIYRSFSQFFLQVKNIFGYICIRKPNIMQTNFIDCMELRSAEIKIHIVIWSISRVYSLCVFHLLVVVVYPLP